MKFTKKDHVGLTALITFLIFIPCIYCQCSTSDPSVGCLTCASPLVKTLNTTSFLMICTTLDYCQACADLCTQCLLCDQTQNALLDPSDNKCVQILGCAQVKNRVCISCQNGYILLQNNTCLSNFQNDRCVNYENSTGACTQCVQQFMNPLNNCLINSSVCQNFSQSLWKCTKCLASDQVLDQSGKFCVKSISNCLKYSISGCQLCQDNYFSNIATCSVIVSKNIYVQYIDKNTNAIITVCLQRDMYFDTVTDGCIAVGTPGSFCQTVQTANNSLCLNCIPRYYLTSNSTCSSCQMGIKNCMICTNNSYCTNCKPGYFVTSDGTACLQCSIYNCQTCYQTNMENVFCSSCSKNQTLFDGSCYQCSQGQGFNITSKSCQACTITTNCSFCEFTYSNNAFNQVCKQCIENYTLSGSNCIPLSEALTNPTLESAYEAFSKQYPGIQSIIYNNQTQLLITCSNGTNGYVCLCNNNETLTGGRSSLCGSPTISGITVNYTNLNLATISQAQFIQYKDQIRMAAQFDTFAGEITFTSPVSQELYAQYLQTYYIISTHQSAKNLSSFISRIRTQLDIMKPTYSTTTNTILNGNGYYYKYSPSSALALQDNSYITVNVSTTSWVLVYVGFNREPGTALTGNIYVYTGQDQIKNCDITVKKLGYLGQPSIKVFNNNQEVSTSVSISEGYLHASIQTSTKSTLNSYLLSYQAVNNLQAFTSQRIENIFYNESFIYILFFFLLYAIMIPCCLVLDCCENKEGMFRKKVNQEQLDAESRPKSDNEIIIKVNYKDFFPMYNIGSTPRPKRLVKLCLFLLNMQHSITFLTLFYFHLNAGLSVVAVILFVPAYICTVIMSYLAGIFVVFVPSHFKFLINFLVIGYWLIWIFVMPMFISTEYKPFIYIFAILMFLLDLIFDALETFLVYFAIKQQQKQVLMFRCLARWLSFRGFYEFNDLAKQIADL